MLHENSNTMLGTLGMGNEMRELYLTEISWMMIGQITEKKNFPALYCVEEKM